MYAQFFGLTTEPFSLAPDPRYLFMSERHREALAHLVYGLSGAGGFVLLSGEIGAGKTTVCRCFLEQIPRRCNVAYIFNPKLTVIELLQSICQEFRVALPPGASTVKDHIDPLNEFLLRSHAVGHNSVLVIDEAQNLSADVLEQLRLLTNLETSERKLLQIVLIGQPELRAMLARPELEQLAQRVIARYHLEALSEDETAQYIGHRLAVAGMTRAVPFDAKALRRIHRLSRGVPRRINLLADRAMLGAYAAGRNSIDTKMVDAAAREVFDRPRRSRSRSRRRGEEPRARRIGAIGAGVAGGVLLAGAVGLVLAAGGLGTLARWGWALPWQTAGVETSKSASAGTPAGARAEGDARERAGAAPPAAVTGAPHGVTGATHGAAGAPPHAAPAGGTPTASASATATAITADAAAAPTPPESPIPRLAGAGPIAGFESPLLDEAQAWRELAAAWALELGAGDPCTAVQQRGLRCFRSARGSLALIRRLDRPAMLTLQDERDQPVYVLLTGLGERSATLRTGRESRTVPLAFLAERWRGGFATFWRVPPGYADRALDVEHDAGPAVEWLAARLAALRDPGTAGAPLKAQLQAFQLAQGLAPDGLAGPLTFMQLNRASGVDEPRLHTES